MFVLGVPVASSGLARIQILLLNYVPAPNLDVNLLNLYRKL